jgi:DNA repair exonuclease SbcCD ATPase subunit
MKSPRDNLADVLRENPEGERVLKDLDAVVERWTKHVNELVTLRARVAELEKDAKTPSVLEQEMYDAVNAWKTRHSAVLAEVERLRAENLALIEDQIERILELERNQKMFRELVSESISLMETAVYIRNEMQIRQQALVNRMTKAMAKTS